jgi:hypothetical protein
MLQVATPGREAQSYLISREPLNWTDCATKVRNGFTWARTENLLTKSQLPMIATRHEKYWTARPGVELRTAHLRVTGGIWWALSDSNRRPAVINQMPFELN